MPRLIDLGDVLAVINASMLNLEYTDENRAMQKAISMLPTVDAERLVELINQLIEEAVEDGGDAGGAYHQNQKGLTKAINDLLEFFGLSNYEVVETNDYYSWSRIMVGKRIDTPTDPVQE